MLHNAVAILTPLNLCITTNFYFSGDCNSIFYALFCFWLSLDLEVLQSNLNFVLTLERKSPIFIYYNLNWLSQKSVKCICCFVCFEYWNSIELLFVF